MMTKQIFEVINPIRIIAHCVHYLGLRDNLGDEHDRIRAVKTGYQSSVCTTVHSHKLVFTSHSWDDVYEREVANFEETGDEGEIW
jgi:hypothetical protein